MSEIVIDASVLARFILKEPEWKDLASLLRRAISVDLVVKEVSNAIWKSYYRGLIGLDDANKKFQALMLLIGTNIELHDGLSLLGRAFEIALNNRITVYDALYIALTERIPNATLFTSDDKQYEVCIKIGLNCQEI